LNRRQGVRPAAACLLLAVLAFLAWGAPAAAAWQGATSGGLTIERVDTSAFPAVTAYVSVLDAEGAPVTGLTPADIEIREDGQPAPAGPVSVASQDPALTLAFALDLSLDFASLNQIRAAVKEIVGGMRPQDQAAIVAYHGEVILAQSLTSTPASLEAALDNLTAEGDSTNLNEAVAEALEQLAPAEAGRKAVIVITNGGDTAAAVTTEAVIEQAQDAGIPVYTVVFEPTVNVAALASLARETGGEPYALNGPGDMLETLETIDGRLRQGYVITYQSGLAAADGEHTLELAVEIDGETVEAQAPFNVAEVFTPITLALSVSEGQELVGVVNLTAQVASSTPIVAVEYQLDGQVLAVVDSPPYTFQWDSRSAPPGPHVLVARAVDTGGRLGEATVNFTIGEITPLIVTASVLRTVEAGGDVTVEARVETSVPVVGVDFLLDDTLLGTLEAPPYTFTVDSAAYEAGEHQITVRAHDSLGRHSDARVAVEFEAPPLTAGQRFSQFVASLARFKRVAFSAVLVLLMVVALAAMGILLGMAGRARKSRLVRVARLQINNTGNAPSRYELWADEPTGALKFLFKHQGAPLPVHGAEPEPARVAPARAAAPAAPAAPGRAPAAPARAPNAAQRAWNLSTPISDLLNTIGYLLPGGAGRGLMNASQSIDDVNYTTARVDRLGGQITDVKTASGAPAAPGARPAPAGASQAATIVEATAGGGNGALAGATQAPRAAKGAGHPWAQTPEVEPAGTLDVDLQVERVKGSGVQSLPFRVLSRCMESPAPPVIEQANIEMGRLPPLLGCLPVFILLGTLGVIIVLVALLIAPPAFVL
jgi:Ca-activated chloride channel family protein